MKSNSNQATRTKYSEYKRGLWTSEEDRVLMDHVKVHGTGKWNRIPRVTGLKRCGKSCRLRWMNYLSPTIKRGNFSAEEDDLIIRLHRLLGNRWSLIAGRVPGRTDNQVKNYWNSHLSKKQAAVDSLQDINIVRKPKLLQPSPSQPPRMLPPSKIGDDEQNKLPADHQAFVIGLQAVATSNVVDVEQQQQPITVDNNDDDTRRVVEQHGDDGSGGRCCFGLRITTDGDNFDSNDDNDSNDNLFMVYPPSVSNNTATAAAADHNDHRDIFDDDELFIHGRDFSDFLMESLLGNFSWDINYASYI